MMNLNELMDRLLWLINLRKEQTFDPLEINIYSRQLLFDLSYAKMWDFSVFEEVNYYLIALIIILKL
jgi:hypothetical protein